jgi:hypothetical protein
MLIALGVIQSVDDAEAKPQCLLYPNPTEGTLNVQWLDGQPTGPMVLRDLSGRVILEARLVPGTTTISTTGIAPGVYLATFGTSSTTTRIVVR